jgi:hypothetical protein
VDRQRFGHQISELLSGVDLDNFSRTPYDVISEPTAGRSNLFGRGVIAVQFASAIRPRVFENCGLRSGLVHLAAIPVSRTFPSSFCAASIAPFRYDRLGCTSSLLACISFILPAYIHVCDSTSLQTLKIVR